jgi:hypothetical protein
MIVPIEKDIVDLVRQGATGEAEKRIVALRVSATAAHLEIRKLKEQLRALERELQLRDSLSYDGQFYWTGMGDAKEGPYCPSCYDAEHLMIRLQYRTVEEIDYETGYTRPGERIFYKCTRCSKKSISELRMR